jgi:hypothetical protein
MACFKLGLKSSFALLDPPETLRSQTSISWLSNQRGRYLASTSLSGSLFTRNSQDYDRRAANISDFDVPAVAVSQVNSSVPAGDSPIGNEMSPALPGEQLHSSLVQPGPVSSNKGSQPIIQNVECSPKRSEAQLLNNSSAEQLSLVEAGMRRDVDSGDTEQMIRNDLQARGWFSRHPIRHRLTEFYSVP